MKKLVLIATFFTLLIASEVIITAVVSQVFDICLTDVSTDSESESDGEEKSEDRNKIEIYVLSSNVLDTGFSSALIFPVQSASLTPYLDRATPPPEV